MSLLELRAEIERKAQEETSKIIESAKRDAEKISAEAAARTEALRNERTRALTRELDAQETTELATARMDRKGELLQLKSEWCNRVFDEAEKRISQIAKVGGREYRELLGKLTLEGIVQLRGNRFAVEVNSRDVDVIRKQLEAIEERASKMKNNKVVLRTATLPYAISGGVVVSSEDGTQSFNNALEARLSAVTRTLLAEAYRILFEEMKD